MSASADPKLAQADAAFEKDDKATDALAAAANELVKSHLSDGGGCLTAFHSAEPRFAVATVVLNGREHPRALHVLHARLYALLAGAGYPCSVTVLR